MKKKVPLELHEELLQQAQELAAEQGVSLNRLAEEALEARVALLERPVTLALPTRRGGLLVDMTDRRAVERSLAGE